MSQLSVSVQVSGVTYNYAADNAKVAREIVETTKSLAPEAQVRANVWGYQDGKSYLIPNIMLSINALNIEAANA